MTKKERRKLTGVAEMMEEFALVHMQEAIVAGKEGRKAADSYNMGKSVAFRRASQEIRQILNAKE